DNRARRRMGKGRNAMSLGQDYRVMESVMRDLEAARERCERAWADIPPITVKVRKLGDGEVT
ncbi:MAG: hypothetical protein NUV75_00530, partial [Gallionella sp.]|nr:hypothetical protein [Gallionella sp.]